MKAVYSGDAFFGWRRCGKCGIPSYVAVPHGGSPSAASLKELVAKVGSHKPGLDALRFLLEHDEAFIDDLLFVAGKPAYADVEFLESLHVLDRKLKTYSIKPALRPYVEELVAPILRRV